MSMSVLHKWKHWQSLLVVIIGLGAVSVHAAAVRTLPGFNSNTLAANDDGSTARVLMGFSVDFYGTNFNSCFVNNNGNITFDRAMGTFTPFGLTSTVAQIIAPFFADVDTRGVGSGLVQYGNDRVDGRQAFGVNWIRVGYFGSHVDRLNSFQLVLISRPDTGPSNFDIEFNYDQIQWETGDASGGSGGLGGSPVRAGYSNGSRETGTFFELPGSGVSGAFLDGQPSTGLTTHSLGSSVPGRYLFRVRGGRIDLGGLQFTKVVDSDIASLGSNLTYTIRFDNSSTAAVQRVVITDPLPAGVTYVSSVAEGGTCGLVSGIVTCAFGDVPTGTGIVARITVVPNQLGDICNEATLTITNGGELTARACVSSLPARTHGQCITRSARYWFTHAQGDDAMCAALWQAIQINGEQLDLGFMNLPVDYQNGDGVKDSADALVEALGIYWRSLKWTGDPDGSQSDRQLASPVCKARKALGSEIIAALANTVYLGTYPTDCRYANGRSVTNFSINLVQQARDVAASEDLNAMRVMTALVRKFNNTGMTNNFFGGLRECATLPNATLRSVSRDPTTKLACPGVSDSCATAQSITRFPYYQTVNLTQYADGFESPSCLLGGANAVWRIAPPVAAAGRNFVIRTKGSNFPTLVSVWRGTDCNNLAEVDCSTTADGSTPSANMHFTADGLSTYYIVIEGQEGQVGKLKMSVTSF